MKLVDNKYTGGHNDFVHYWAVPWAIAKAGSSKLRIMIFWDLINHASKKEVLLSSVESSSSET